MKKQKVVIDCDNTYGIPGKPIDDGQAILYLMGSENIDILGITTTFGNSSIEDVYPATKWLVAHSIQPEIPVLKGSCSSEDGLTEASEFLAEITAVNPGEINLIAIGTMGNPFQANLKDPGFYGNLKQIICMGGYMYPLPVRGWNNISELNLSRNYKAAQSILNAECPVTLFNAHICFQAPFGLEELAPFMGFDRKQYYIMKEYLLKSIEELTEPKDYLWDLLPALYVSRPSLFHHNPVCINTGPEEMKTGTLAFSEKGAVINMPDYITDIDTFYNMLYRAWQRAPLVIPDRDHI